MTVQKITKASLIRQAFDELGWGVSSKDVITFVAAQGVAVTPQQVSNEKLKRARQNPAAQVEDLPVSLLKKVKALVDELGSTDLVRRALNDLEALTPRPKLNTDTARHFDRHIPSHDPGRSQDDRS
jgi:hypothetical protein